MCIYLFYICIVWLFLVYAINVWMERGLECGVIVVIVVTGIVTVDGTINPHSKRLSRMFRLFENEIKWAVPCHACECFPLIFCSCAMESNKLKIATSLRIHSWNKHRSKQNRMGLIFQYWVYLNRITEWALKQPMVHLALSW